MTLSWQSHNTATYCLSVYQLGGVKLNSSYENYTQTNIEKTEILLIGKIHAMNPILTPEYKLLFLWFID